MATLLAPLFEQHEIDLLAEAIKRSHKITVVCHLSPDGDALGSSLAAVAVMRSMGKEAVLVTPDMPPENLSFLPGFDKIVVASAKPDRAHVLIKYCDLLLCLDFNSVKRIDKIGPSVEDSKAFKVMIDHHLKPELSVNLMFSRPDQSSTCVLFYRILHQLGFTDYLDRESAECLMTGVLTDTGGLAYNSLDPQLYLVVSDLLEFGVDKDRLYTILFRTSSLNRLRLQSFALSQRMIYLPAHRAAVIKLSAEDLRQFDYVKGMTEGLVNIPLEIPEVVYSVFLREDMELRYVKVSMRSKGTFPVDKFCSECFGGGGHLNAAGGDIHASVDEAFRITIDSMPQFDKYLPGN